MARRLSVCRLGFALALVATTASAAPPACREPGRFVTRDDTVADRETGLTWRRCSLGLAWSAANRCDGELAQLTYGEAEAAAGKAGPDWRLPTADELVTLLTADCGGLAIDREIFSDVPISASGEGSAYWTSTPAGLDDMMITVDFRYGFPDMHSRGLAYHVRLVHR